MEGEKTTSCKEANGNEKDEPSHEEKSEEARIEQLSELPDMKRELLCSSTTLCIDAAPQHTH